MADELGTRDIDERQARALEALVLMVDRVLKRRPDGRVDSGAMGAPEHAIMVLAEYGLIEMEVVGRIFGRWTELGSEARKTASNRYPDTDQRRELPAEYLEYGRAVQWRADHGEEARKAAPNLYPAPDQRLEFPDFSASDEADITEALAPNIDERERRLLEAYST
jgi:hypothetical protein